MTTRKTPRRAIIVVVHVIQGDFGSSRSITIRQWSLGPQSLGALRARTVRRWAIDRDANT